MSKPTVYLAGPIVGCTDKEANDWRRYVADRVAVAGVRAVSPLRCEPIRGEHYDMGNNDPKFGTARAIGAKNIYDVRNTDMTLAYIPAPPEGGRHSWGTMCELAGAHFINKQTILVSDDPIVLSHPVLDGMAGWVLNTLDEAIEVISGVLGGYTEEGKNV